MAGRQPDAGENAGAAPVGGQPAAAPPADVAPPPPAGDRLPGVAAQPGQGSRAGRNLPVAIAVGLALGAVILVPLYTHRAAFVVVLAVTVAVGTRELGIALRPRAPRIPLAPVIVGAVAMQVLAYTRGEGGLAVGLFLTVVAAIAWRGCSGADGALADVAAATFTACYVGFLAGFAALLTAPVDGARLVTTFIATVVCSDVGGLAAGVLAGRHPLAPSISPRKSWEGLAGSLTACAVAGVVFLTLLLHEPAWTGVVYGLVVAVTATLGDLVESLLKRDLGIKDMGTLLPGHGGIMDRLDSLLLTAPVAFLLLSAFAGVARP